jgi:hypothetical protein
MTAQVYGGSLSLVIGAYLWSRTVNNFEYATCSAGDTVVSGLWTELNNIRISDSRAFSSINISTLQAQNHTFRMLEF